MTKTERIELVNGKHIHFRFLQMILWSAIAAVLGSSFIAGLYYGILQMHWYIHIGSFQWNGFSLKHWWDNLYHSPSWNVYRHSAFRDIAEPSFAVMGVLTLIVKPKYWDRDLSAWRLVLSPFILIALTFGLGLGGAWLLNFGLPEHIRSVLNHGQLGNLVLGFLIGRILHKFWAPVGAVYQRKILGNKVLSSLRSGHTPLWVRLPLAPPVLRERFSTMWFYAPIHKMRKVTKAGGVGKKHWSYWYLTFMMLAFTLVTALGIVAHYYIGKGHSVPYLAP